jgi:hypothetical protein
MPLWLVLVVQAVQIQDRTQHSPVELLLLVVDLALSVVELVVLVVLVVVVVQLLELQPVALALLVREPTVAAQLAHGVPVVVVVVVLLVAVHPEATLVVMVVTASILIHPLQRPQVLV